ncbi:MAG TPA: hypothetical protein VEX16_03795 [Methyloceanibacter sp.]|nr:hypothetical protein [Methyloceanibacter sp.]
MFRIVEARDEVLNAIMKPRGHVRMHENRCRWSIVQRGFKSDLALLEAVDLILEQGRIDATFEGLNQLFDRVFGSRQFRRIGIPGRVVLATFLVHSLGIRSAKDLAHFRLHQLRLKRSENGLLQRSLADGEAIVARPFVPRR